MTDARSAKTLQVPVSSQLTSPRHKAIVAYLSSANFPNSAAALREELGEDNKLDDATVKKYEGLLEKKWTSVVRLQKKVNGYETRGLLNSHLTRA